MSIRTRMGVAAVLLAAFTVVAFGAVAYALFVRQQDRQLEQVLQQDLDRVAALMAQPRIGSTLPTSGAEGYILQLVTASGRIAVSWGDAQPLPFQEEPTVIHLDGAPYLVGATAHGPGGGSIRLAHDVSGAMRIRSQLLQSLVLGGVLVALGGGALGLVSARRLLAPLRRVADRTRELDPADPGTIELEYAGPDDEVSDLVTALNGALSSIRSQKREERMFLTEVAHELAAPLTLVSYHLDAANEKYRDESLRAAAAAARELLRTSQDLLVLARGEIERPLEWRVFRPADLVERLADEYPGIRVDVRFAAEIVGDPERLMQAVRNVVRNAVQATASPSGVTLTLREDADACVFEVRDEGPGMSDAVAARVFDRLYSKTHGAGVGLSVAKAIVEQHGGSISVASELGAGTTFEVRVPIRASAADGIRDTARR